MIVISSMNHSKLKIASLSDLHLGHSKNKAKEIITNLMIALPDNQETGDLDMIFLVGDVFDTLLSFPDSDVREVHLWFVWLLNLCKKYDIVLRVLEGTPSHDWMQCEILNTINASKHLGVDLKYVKELSIEYNERFDINILYVPDEWEHCNEKTLCQVKELMKAKGLTTVDIALMHGQFEYQLPAFIKAQKHNSVEYLKLVSGLIFIGHVHTYSRYDRIVAHGSFDRIRHGEEEAKGHVRATLYRDNSSDVVFVETVNAKRFVTVDCSDLDIEETLAKIDLVVVGLPDNSFVRIRADHDNPIFTNMDLLIRKYLFVSFSKDPLEDNGLISDSVIDEEVILFNPITITKDNITNLLLARVTAVTNNVDILEAATILLKEFT
jgi:hypothetical protein